MRMVLGIVIVGALWSADAAHADTDAQSIEVVGSRIVQLPPTMVFVADLSPTYGLDGMPSNAMLAQRAQLIRAAEVKRDVRCVLPSDLRRTTSRSDVVDRWLAASQVYAIVQQVAPTIKNLILGTAKSPYDGITYKAFQVTYADNGKEKWLVFPEPRASIKLFDTPLPSSLVQEDGVVRPSPWCGM